jgi:hypothetical protein
MSMLMKISCGLLFEKKQVPDSTINDVSGVVLDEPT